MSKKFKLKIVHDDDPMNPREEFDNAGTMICKHRRYDLGDKKESGKYQDMEDFLVSNLQETGSKLPVRKADASYLRRLLEAFEEKHYWLPLFLYDHSGITMKTTPFSCRFDSGLVGIIYISKKKAEDEWGDHHYASGEMAKSDYASKTLDERAIAYLTGEVETYNQYLTGDVWGYVITSREYDNEGNKIKGTKIEEHSCWGFYGRDYCEQEGKSMLEFCEKEEAENTAECAKLMHV